jgi:hypothetical protein
MDEKLNELFHKTVFYLTDEDKLKYSRYQAIAGLKAKYTRQILRKCGNGF